MIHSHFRRSAEELFGVLQVANATNVTKPPPTEGGVHFLVHFRPAYFVGILSGVGPLGTPILTLLVQIMLIQLLSRVLAVPFKWVKQPQVRLVADEIIE